MEYRETNGRFTNRRQLLKVAKLGPKAFDQCAGFMRILDGENPLDATSVHPESYEAAMKLLDRLGLTMDDIRALQKKAAAEKAAGKAAEKAGQGDGRSDSQSAGQVRSGAGQGRDGAGTAQSNNSRGSNRRNDGRQKTIQVRNTSTAMGKALAAAMGSFVAEDTAADKKNKNQGRAGYDNAAGNVHGEDNTQTATVTSLEKRIKNKKELAEELGIGEITLTDILKELEKPARDPRDDMPKPILRSDVLEMKDLKPGMILKGTVRNVIDFGVFVDIGVHQDGLVHISQITDRFIKHPLEAVSVGDIVEVQVVDLDAAKKRIALTMKIKPVK